MDKREHDHGPDRRERIPTRWSESSFQRPRRALATNSAAASSGIALSATSFWYTPRKPEELARRCARGSRAPGSTGASASSVVAAIQSSEPPRASPPRSSGSWGPNQAKSRANFGTASTVNAGRTARPACTTDWRRPSGAREHERRQQRHSEDEDEHASARSRRSGPRGPAGASKRVPLQIVPDDPAGPEAFRLRVLETKDRAAS